ncbi:MAG TPA: uroporphyrinogen-III synthase [Acidimicrobiia bacterium]|nr:uroporphyrinogen-III synthase [Acidimicrobiia bacterium]
MTRVAITTDRFESAGRPFRRYGLEPVSLPCIRIEPAGGDVLAEAREAAVLCDLVLITSARTVDLLWPDGPMPPSPVAAVGERTAAAVEARGGRLALAGRAGLADLLDQLGSKLDTATVVFPHAGRPPTTPDDSTSLSTAIETLRGRAANLKEFEVYRTISLSPGTDAVAAAAFSSPSAVAGWHLSRSFDSLVIGVIGSTTRLAVSVHRKPEVVAPQPSHDALARAMASYLEVSS